jgi:hypothetical protein
MKLRAAKGYQLVAAPQRDGVGARQHLTQVLHADQGSGAAVFSSQVNSE